MPKVSAVLITWNEEADIARALQSVSWCDEILVVDSGSTDRTVDICKAHGCKVLYRKFTGYGEQKAFAVAQAAHDWVFNVDADEEVSPALKSEILASLDRAGDCRGYYIPITTILWDQVVRTGPRHTKPKLRLFDRRYGNFQKQLVHESVSLDGRTEELHDSMLNHSYANIADYFDKFNRYTSAAAAESFSRGKRSSFLGVVVRLPLVFLQLYFLKGFFRDGSTGLTWSLFSSFYPAVKQIKLLELWRSVPASELRVSSAEREASVRAVASGRAMRTVSRTRLSAYLLAAGIVTVALLVMGHFGQDMPGNYSVLLLASVVACAFFWGFWPALVAIGMALVGLDYYTISPLNSFSLPNRGGLIQLSVFAVSSLVVSILVYNVKRQSLR